MRRLFHITLAIFAGLFLLTSCSKKKSGFTNRLYHNTTSHYNWYFNASEIMRLTKEQVWTSKEEDYLELLPVYVMPTEEGAKNLYPQMDEVIEKCSTVIDRHSMEISKKEHNKWIDDCYLMIGVANFYKGQYAKSEEMSSYVAKKYKGQSSRFEAAIWLARTYIEQERYGKAATVLSVVEDDNSKDRPKGFAWQLEAVKAQMMLRQNRYKDAIPYLEDASILCTDKQMKARLTYILAQVYNIEGRNANAISAYETVVDLKPDYEMEFYAKISQALAFDRKLDSKKIKDMLLKMANDEKNEEYYDQIYYALADIEIEEQNIPQGVDYLKTSIRTSIDNPVQKGKSYLRLAELNFADRNYVLAKNYYDSTATILPEDFPNYKSIVAKANSLNDLVNNLEIVSTNDSLIALASLDEKDRDKKILKIMAQLEAEKEQKRQEELDALERLQNRPNFSSGGSSGSGRKWYFYNTNALSSGFTEFKSRWGDRPNEDNWRRSMKTDINLSGPLQGIPSDSLLANVGADEEEKTLEDYLEELPLDAGEMDAAHYAVIEALYDIGTIYKERLQDDDNAIESFLRITNDYDTSSYSLPAHYQLYRIYVEKEESGGFVGTGFRDNSMYYKTVILADYPDSEFAKLITNPEYITDKNRNIEEERKAYESTYKKYSRRQYTDVLLACNTVIRDEPNNNYLSKYYLIKALTIGAQKQPEAYETLLREIIAKFRGTEEADKAAELLGNLNELKAQLARDEKKANGKDSDEDLSVSTSEDNSAFAVNTSMYKVKDDSEHFFALIFPKAEDSSTDIKETIADFNSNSFRSENLRITNSFIDRDHQIIIVRSFGDKETAMNYFNTFAANQSTLKELNGKEYQTFVITTKNFTTLFRNKNADVYQAFFEQNYL
ncbi:MAG: tetratricopeptide repeat protein [Flavobacteriales bacterium]|nr:tetratricopeptide repeat protein [Flavobacteriales bacterium]